MGGLMTDAAAAEIARCQLWQRIRMVALRDDGRAVTREFVDRSSRTSRRPLRPSSARATGQRTRSPS
ncbi:MULTISPECIES: hypothetical protein [unclassified Pseudofrankia]|uniref:hypothetical protein n=1 Tax=unclassified Pseudofrankia TaxID=2994372 RepID=UPI001F5182A4|nr:MULTISPECIES: hypothetical protein [unclassified Pseudofrankia]MDT3446632.1 hypothetical protein [Pseudofrankia sp. BMG5.37]